MRGLLFFTALLAVALAEPVADVAAAALATSPPLLTPPVIDEATIKRLLPSKYAVEQIGVRFLDALIKRGQMEMAKGAFKTQLEVLEKVHPDQYEKYKKLKVDDLAADAVLQQAEMAKLQPKTGNAFVDMLNENGIPIGSSLKGIEQAIKTQKEMETQDPSEQIAKAVLEKFQQQILPGLVANMIAGRNPFKVPQQMRSPQASPQIMRQQALAAQTMTRQDFYEQQALRQAQAQAQAEARAMARAQARRTAESESESYSQNDIRYSEPTVESRHLARRLRSSPRLRALLENPTVLAALTSRQKDDPFVHGRHLARIDQLEEEKMRQQTRLDGKAAIVLGMHDMFGEEQDDEEEEQEEQQQSNSIRRAPLSLSSAFIRNLEENPDIRDALRTITYRVSDVDKLMEPKKRIFNPKPQPGFFVPRKIPTRPRKMLPLLIGLDPNEEKSLRRKQSSLPKEAYYKKSRTLTNLQNNPNLAPLFMDGSLEQKLTGRSVLSNDQKGRYPIKTIKTLPRLFGARTFNPIDGQVTQMIEERPVPPAVWNPKGRHTRLRWTGATEKEIPGIGGRFILPSLDPTQPAVNTAYSTQGRARDEWDTIFKVPNNWNPGDEIGFSANQKSERFVGGNGGFDMPALGLRR